jgi:hypothetical protein
MAYQRKPLTPSLCKECGDPYEAVDRRRLYCCPGCKTAASQARRPSTVASAKSKPATPVAESSAAREQSLPALPLVTESALAAPPTTPGNPSFGKLVLANTTGNLLADMLKALWAPKAAAGSAPTSGWPTWPPAELLAATGPPVQLSDPTWPAPQVLTPVTYHRHQLYLYVEEGMTVVVRQEKPGLWHYVRTPAELAQLAACPPVPVPVGIQALIAKYEPTTGPVQAAGSAPVTAPDKADETP